MQTELGVRGGPSLSLFLARAETILVIDVRLLWCGPDFVGSLVAKAWYVGFFIFFWIIKNLLPKRTIPKQIIQAHVANGHKSRRKSDNTSPINIGKGHQRETNRQT